MRPSLSRCILHLFVWPFKYHRSKDEEYCEDGLTGGGPLVDANGKITASGLRRSTVAGVARYNLVSSSHGSADDDQLEIGTSHHL